MGVLMETNTENNPSLPPKRKRIFRRFAFISLFVIVILLFLFYLICGMSYSEGTHTGILTKVSKKGLVFKTYEGEMNIGGISDGPGTIMPLTVFEFSVKDQEVYKRLEELQGKKVTVRYKQVLKSFFWQGETGYFIQDVFLVKE